MICLKSPKSSEFAFFNKLWSKILDYVFFIVLTTIQLNFKNSKILKKRYAPSWIRTRNPWMFEATEQLRNRMCKENCRKCL